MSANAAQALGAIEDDDLVDRPVAAHERRRAGLQHPRDVNVRRMSLERVDHRQHMHRVAHRAHHDDAHAAKRRRMGSEPVMSRKLARRSRAESSRRDLARCGTGDHTRRAGALRKCPVGLAGREDADDGDAERGGDVQWPRVVPDDDRRERQRRRGRRERPIANLIDVGACRMCVRCTQLVQLARCADPEHRSRRAPASRRRAASIRLSGTQRSRAPANG